MTDGPDELLAFWKQDGTLESQGQFTLDPNKGLSKLRSALADDPWRYILRLVSWSSALGAGAIHITTGPGKLEFKPDDLILNPQDLETLLQSTNTEGDHHFDLALASAAASCLPGSKVTIQAPGASLIIDSGGMRLEQTEDQETSWTLLQSSKWNWAKHMWNQRRPDVDLLKDLCALSDVPILLNQTLINQPLEVPTIRRAIWLNGPPLAIPEELKSQGSWDLRSWNGDFSVLVVSSTFPILEAPAIYLVRGVRFKQPPVVCEGEPLMVAVAAPKLQLDLSGRTIIDNQEFREIQEQVKKLASEVV